MEDAWPEPALRTMLRIFIKHINKTLLNNQGKSRIERRPKPIGSPLVSQTEQGAIAKPPTLKTNQRPFVSHASLAPWRSRSTARR
jgi:hypothetical protein